MLSGLHTVSPIFCSVCNNTKAIGWKYVNYLLNTRLRLIRPHKSLNKVNLYLKFTILGNKVGSKMMIKVAESNHPN